MISNLSEVPPNWIKVRFDEIAENITDRIDKPNESGLEYYIGLEHLDTDQIRIKRFGSTEDVKATKFLCKKGDIIFGKRNAYLRKVAITDRDSVVSAHSMVIRPIGDLIVPDFLPCFMQSSVFWKTAHAISEGSMSPTIKWKTLAKQEFWIPSVQEQKKISDVLWTIERNAEKNENLITSFEDFKRGLLAVLLTRGIGHKKFKRSEFGEIPEDWEIREVQNVCDFLDSQRVPVKKTDRKKRPGPYPYYGAQGIIDWIDEYIFEGSYLLVAEDGENLRSKVLPIAYQVSGSFWVNNHAHVIKPKNTVNAAYLEYVLNFIDIGKYITGSAQPKLSQNSLSKIKLALPPVNEQKEIVQLLNSLDQKIQKVLINMNCLNHLKKKTTDEFLSGNLRILQEAHQNVQ